MATASALIKHLDGIGDAEIAELDPPTGAPLLYELDDQLRRQSPLPRRRRSASSRARRTLGVSWCLRVHRAARQRAKLAGRRSPLRGSPC